jgi:N-acyl-D-amino-acid deacylase
MAGYLIKNAYLIDGSGADGAVSDLFVKNGKIANFGRNLPENEADETINAKGLCLAPGFIDSHGHSDISILAAPEATGKLSQGVTTEITGNCGLSVFPVTDKNREHLNELYRNYNENISWNDISGYAAELEKRSSAINIASLCGHNTLRAAINGYENNKLSPEKLSEMQELLQKELKNGACGFSTGLLYVPGKFANNAEITALLKTLREDSQPYTTHLRSESKELLEAIQKSIDMCQKAKAPKLHISHLKTARQENWHKLDSVLNLIEKNNSDSLQITADRYPYTESMTQLSIILPEPFDEFDSVALEKELVKPDSYEKLIKKLKEFSPERWEKIKLVTCSDETLAPLFGKTISEIAKTTGKTPYAICAEVLKKDSAGALAAFSGGMSSDNMKRILNQPFVCCCTDENARPEDYSIGRSHPRAFGSFARFMNFVKAGNSLEEAVRKMTSLPASIFNLKGRGLLKPGYAADLVLFSPEEIADNADFANPHSLSSGIRKVFVNGILSFEDGALTGKRNGHFLKN